MFKKPEEARMAREESEKYECEIDSKNDELENVEMGSEEIALPAE